MLLADLWPDIDTAYDHLQKRYAGLVSCLLYHLSNRPHVHHYVSSTLTKIDVNLITTVYSYIGGVLSQSSAKVHFRLVQLWDSRLISWWLGDIASEPGQ